MHICVDEEAESFVNVHPPFAATSPALLLAIKTSVIAQHMANGVVKIAQMVQELSWFLRAHLEITDIKLFSFPHPLHPHAGGSICI